ncbi:MAG: BMP family ABC transporter substrate-binding protein [Clostridiales bacterium]|nr:BMP family ABC transporter substrate-binding protein [Clostridiales bacterium]MDD6872524.1 BMP family ABC transporter substrate-binding protein [Clostridiales bacterium]
MKKVLSLVLVLAMVLMFSAVASADAIPADQIKVGLILLHDENIGYDEIHLNGFMEMVKALGLTEEQYSIKYNVPETEVCYDKAIELVDEGCDIIFADSFGHESYMLQAAAEHPEVQFCHATGYQAKGSGLTNMHNYFTAIYEARYVSGVVAGLKLNEMIDNGKITAEQAVMGYVGAYPYAEVISGYTAFYLGARSVCPSVTMKVTYTNSWADMALEKEAADALIAQGCVLISQHADTTGAPTACQAAGVPCVGYNVSMISVAPDSALTSAAVVWGPYYTYAAKCLIDGEEIATDWCKGYVDGAVEIKELNEKVVAAGTEETVNAVIEKLKNGELHVFDTSTFTVDGKTLEDETYVWDGYYHESELASAPSFTYIVDGITVPEA